MSISSKNKISLRKQNHIDACREGNAIENVSKTGFEALQFVHTALPELAIDEIQTETFFLGKKIQFPFFISCMTGGTEEGRRANRELAKAAHVMKVPVGLGSIRVLFEEPEREKDFALRSLCPEVPILANLGAVQLKKFPSLQISEWLKRLEVDALVVHLNCGQELFQAGGDRNFCGLIEAIEQAVETYSLPLIVKETGFGIRPSLVKKLIDAGVTYVDLAGAGGANWILIEEQSAQEFADWGLPTAPLLEACSEFSEKILASGGLRSGMDLAKSLALGAVASGMALPLIRAALEGGDESVCRYLAKLHHVLQSVMVLTGCKTLDALKNAPLLKTQEHEHLVNQLRGV